MPDDSIVMDVAYQFNHSLDKQQPTNMHNAKKKLSNLIDLQKIRSDHRNNIVNKTYAIWNHNDFNKEIKSVSYKMFNFGILRNVNWPLLIHVDEI